MRRTENPRGKIGMWLFISSEVLLFGGLFLLYAMYRYKNPLDFHNGALELSRFFGTLNTAILITSSLAVALSIFYFKADKKEKAELALLATIVFGLAFLVIKGFEWGEKFMHGLYPQAPHLLALPKGEILYFGLYFMMTGLHALHVLIGICIFSVILFWIRNKRLPVTRSLVLENTGLYWHLVDIIWIFLFPLFYLIT
jgi:cytochrome c oxidase subunit III